MGRFGAGESLSSSTQIRKDHAAVANPSPLEVARTPLAVHDVAVHNIRNMKLVILMAVDPVN